MSNIHELHNNSNNNRNVGIQNSLNDSSNSSRDDRLFERPIYKFRSVTAILIILNLVIFTLQVIYYYWYYEKRGLSWYCLLMSLGSFQGGKIRYHYQYHRFITATFLHSSSAHVGSNCLSLFFLGFRVEHEINNKIYFFLLYMISGLIGHFNTLIFKVDSSSVGASGAIIGLYGTWVIYFMLNYRNMTERKRNTYAILFLFLFINLFSGLSEGQENINMASHIGGFIGGFCFSIILSYKLNYRMQTNNKNSKRLYYYSIIFLVAFPIISLVCLYLKKVSRVADFICRF